MKIYITPQVFLKLKYYANATDKEISGMGHSILLDDETILVDEVYCFKQTGFSASTELDKKDVANFYDTQAKKGIDTSTFNVWWHSHVDMEPFFSVTDDTTAKSFLSDTYIVSIVINKAMKMYGRIDVYKPFKHYLEVDVKMHIDDEQLKKTIEAEVKKKVKTSFIWEDKRKKKKNNKSRSKRIDYIDDLDDEIIENIINKNHGNKR